MSQRNSANITSARNSLAGPANDPYDAILAHYAKERSDDGKDQHEGEDNTIEEDTGSTTSATRNCNPSRRINEASPESEDSLEKLSRASNDGYHDDVDQDVFDAGLSRLKKSRRLFAVLTLALAVALLGTLGGLIFLAVTRNNSAPSETDASASTSGLPIPTLRDTNILTMKFEEANNIDPSIASVFADQSLYKSFYGVTYNGIETSNCSASGFQQLLAKDLALLSRVTERVRVVKDTCNLTDRILNAIMDIKINLSVVLNIKASEWAVRSSETRRILASYPRILFDSVLIEQDDTVASSYRAYSELESFLERKNIEDIQIRLIDPTEKQPNPLEFANDPNNTRNWVVNDKARLVYTNLESPVETSEKARAMTLWVCGVSDHLDPGVAWFWSTGFDSKSGVRNGIFTVDRKLKPAGLPRCVDYV